MQYITQCVLAREQVPSNTDPPRPSRNYLLFQIVKEQPKCLSSREEALNTLARFQATLFTDSSAMRFTIPRGASAARAIPACVPGLPRRAPLVEPTGIEPVTSCLQSRRSPS